MKNTNRIKEKIESNRNEIDLFFNLIFFYEFYNLKKPFFLNNFYN